MPNEFQRFAWPFRTPWNSIRVVVVTAYVPACWVRCAQPGLAVQASWKEKLWLGISPQLMVLAQVSRAPPCGFGEGLVWGGLRDWNSLFTSRRDFWWLAKTHDDQSHPVGPALELKKPPTLHISDGLFSIAFLFPSHSPPGDLHRVFVL